MSDIKLKLIQFSKDKQKTDSRIVTSVNLEARHREFILQNKINLSALIRDVIDQLIKNSETKKAE